MSSDERDPGAVARYRGRHGTFAHYAADRCIGLSLARYGEWAEAEIALLSRFVPAGGTVVDVGAHVGTHALAFSRLVGPGGTVLAIEGAPEIHALLCRNVLENGHADRVRPVAALVGDRLGLAPVLPAEPSANLGGRVFAGEVREPDRPVPPSGLLLHVPVITLDSLRLPRCDLLKIDVEGMEADVLRGASGLLSSCRPVVYFEHASGDAEALAAIHARLSAVGYRLHWHVANPFNTRNLRGETENIFAGAVEVNVLACPPGAAAPDLPEIRDPRAEPPRPDPAGAAAGVPVPEHPASAPVPQAAPEPPARTGLRARAAALWEALRGRRAGPEA